MKKIAVSLLFLLLFLCAVGCRKVTPPAPQEIVKDILPHLHVVEFHYTPSLGESLFEDELTEWADLLKANAFDGLVVFCPHLRPDENILQHCMALQACADFFLE